MLTPERVVVRLGLAWLGWRGRALGCGLKGWGGGLVVMWKD